MPLVNDCRWPPCYDAEDLKEAIASLSRDLSVMYTPVNDNQPAWCQGDLVSMTCRAPFIDEDGKAVAEDEFDYWIIVGNTCDFARTIEVTQFTQLVPVLIHPICDVTPADLDTLRRYSYCRQFFLPPWHTLEEQRVHIADFTHVVSCDKRAFDNHFRLLARMSRSGWMLLHACLVRFLARDDGRLDR